MSLYETMKRLGFLEPEPEDTMERKPIIRATKATTQALRKIAVQFGYVLTAGALAGDGDVPALLEAIAKGELTIQRDMPQQDAKK